MRLFAIKHKGKTILQNLLLDRELTFLDGKFYAGLLFFRKKDAEKSTTLVII